MNNFTLEEIFGVGASQDGEKLIIQKASLPGLTPSANNRAEQILIAIFLQLLKSIRDKIYSDQGDEITTEAGQAIAYDNSANYKRLDCFLFNQWIDRNLPQKIKAQIVIHAYLFPLTPPPQALTPDSLNYAD